MITTESLISSIHTEAWKIFTTKNKDYGASFAYLRPPSITDQLFIKIKRIRTIEDLGNQKIADTLRDDMLGIINYAVIGILRRKNSEEELVKIPHDALVKQYEDALKDIASIRTAKNHDYGEAWRDMRTTSITDQIFSKVIRIKTIEKNNETVSGITEGIVSLLQDIVNYGFFWIIQHDENKEAH